MKEERDCMIPNRPSLEGALLGKELARLADKAESEAVQKYPNTKVRCKTCAFRLGTVPNRCVVTVMDALKCVMEQVPFFCHENRDEPCMGWVDSAYTIAVTGKPLQTPWKFSHLE